MLLSQLIETHSSRLCLAYSHNIRLDVLPNHVSLMITHLNLSHCNLSSLDGIQQFQHITFLDLRSNLIDSVDQLARISTHQLYCLDLRGNEVQYNSKAIFINLINQFPTLRELNGRNYETILDKRGKAISLGNILTKANRVQKQLAHTLKREQSKNYSLMIHMQPKHQHEDQDEEEDEDEDENQIGVQVSLSALSNVPLRKSIRGSMRGSQASCAPKRVPLQILTANESHTEHMPLTQPTATFASQRQKENGQCNNFLFRNAMKTHKFSGVSEQEEHQLTVDSSMSEEGLLRTSQMTTRHEKEVLALAYYNRCLADRVFGALYEWSLRSKGIPKQKNSHF